MVGIAAARRRTNSFQQCAVKKQQKNVTNVENGEVEDVPGEIIATRRNTNSFQQCAVKKQPKNVATIETGEREDLSGEITVPRRRTNSFQHGAIKKQPNNLATIEIGEKEDVPLMRARPPRPLSNQDEYKEELREMYSKLRAKCRREGHSYRQTFKTRIWEFWVKIAYFLSIYIERDYTDDDVDKQDRIKMDVLIRWASHISDCDTTPLEVAVSARNSLVPLLENKQRDLKDDYISEDDFIELLFRHHKEVTKELQPLEKIFKALAYADNVRWYPPRMLMVIISSLQILHFLFYHESDCHKQQCDFLVLNPYREFPDSYRYITYAFVHYDQYHLMGNIFGQLIIGISLEFTNRWWQVLLVYLSGVLAGSLFHHVSDPKVFLCGASGGLYALIFAHLATIILNWNEDKFILVRRISVFSQDRPIQTKQVRWLRIAVVLLYITLDLMIQFCWDPIPNGVKTSVVAHFSGGGLGLLIATLCFYNRKTEVWEVVLRFMLKIFTFLVFTIIIIFNFFGFWWYPDYFPAQQKLGWSDAVKCCYLETRKDHDFCKNDTLIPDLKDPFRPGNVVNCHPNALSLIPP